MKQCRWGVLGPGFVATRAVIPALQRVEQASVVAVASRNRERGRAVAARFDIERVYADYQGLLDDESVDAVYIALPNHLHREWTIRAARAGKHVLCEKPLATSSGECEEMIAACRGAGVYLMEAIMYRFHPRMQYVKRLLGEGELGDVRFVHCSFSFPLRDRENYRNYAQYGGGSLLDVGSYCVNAARWLIGGEPEMAWGMTRRREEGGIDVATSGLLRFAGGEVAHIQCSFEAAEHQVIEVIGSARAVTAPLAFTAWQNDSTTLMIQNGSGSCVAYETFKPDDPYEIMVAYFSSCVLSQQPPSPAAEDGLATLRVLEALRRS